MSFPRYPDYKDSGVAWLGLVPEHWIVIPLKRDIEFVTSGARGWAENYADDGDLFLRIGNLTRDSIRLDLSDTQRVVVPDGAEVDRTQVQAGDILFSITAYLGSVAVVPAGLGRAFVSQHVALVRPSKKHCLSEWLAYVAISYVGKTHLETTGYGGTKVQLSLADVTSLPIIVPPIDEQQAIATFLDRETAKIDALVAEQEKLIALLQEKRQAVISHAVTKGLDPSVPMKDSGVEWLGEVPGHWEVCALRRVIATIEQGWSPECYAREAEEQEWGVLKAGCLNGGNFRPSENKALPPELCPEEAYEVRVGDVLMSRASGSPELVGSTALVKATRERLMLSDKIFRLKLKEFVNTAFFVAALNSRPLRIQIENALSGGNGMANNLPQSSLMTFAMAVPTLAEQATITVFLEQETAKLDILMAEARTAITLLQERRTALISAAVTGQIDVRSIASREVA